MANSNNNDVLCQAPRCPAVDEVGGHTPGITVFPPDRDQVDCLGWD